MEAEVESLSNNNELEPSSRVNSSNMTEVSSSTNMESSNASRARASQRLSLRSMSAKSEEPIVFVPPAEGTPAALALAANANVKVTKIQKMTKKLRSMRRPKMKNFNIVKQLNKKTKKKRKVKHFSKNFKGKVIDGLHEQYTISAGIVLGVRYCLRSQVDADGVPLEQKNITLADFSHVEKVAFPASGSTKGPNITPSHDLVHTFKFKSYAPRIFERLRMFFNIDTDEYRHSVCGDYNFIEFISNSKSGQFFFYSHDGKYMIKTQTKDENKFMKRILPHYFKFVTENPFTTLIRIVGMHRVKMYHLRRKVHFVIMTSVFDTPSKINTIYDLKGSLIGRCATVKEKESGGVLKDMDLGERKLHFGNKKTAFMIQLQKDAKFLASLNIMDYSLLVGIHDRSSRLQNIPSIVVAEGSHSNTPFRRPSHSRSNTVDVRDEGKRVAKTIEFDKVTSRHKNSSKRSDSLKPESRKSSIVNINGEDAEDEEDDGVEDDEEENGEEELYGDDEGEEELYGDDEGDEEDEDDEEEDDDDEYEDIDEGDSDGNDDLYRVFEGFNCVDISEPISHTRSSDSLSNSFNGKQLVVVDGSGARGVEGDNLSTVLKTRELSKNNSSQDMRQRELSRGSTNTSPNNRTNYRDVLHSAMLSVNSLPTQPTDSGKYTYGPGAAKVRPWTIRSDGGINSRVNNKQGNEIYYVGLIDILQQYNNRKRGETFFKAFVHDIKQISSVDPETYAERFVDFMDAHID